MLSAALDCCRSVFDVVVPVRCALCGRHDAHVCPECCERLTLRPLIGRGPQADVPEVVALGSYAGSLRRAVLELKFRHRRAAAFRLGAILGAKLHDSVDAIVPVPLHHKRLTTRGFNQAEVIAEGIASTFDAMPCDDALVRTGTTVAQSSLSLRDRRRNVHKVFALGPGAAHFRNARIMIVDDVVTTGATIAACAAVLRESSVSNITAVALAIRL